MNQYLPSMTALMCFDAVARHGSVSRAAAELNVTQSAVSRQVSSLESLLKCSLFRRERKRLHLTRHGEEYARDVADILNRTRLSAMRLMTNGQAAGKLTIGVLPTFGTRWLMPRLGEFVRLRPSTEINIVTKIRPFRFEHDMADLVIHYGSADWANAHVTYLMDEELAVLAAPALLAERPVHCPADLAAHTLLQHTTRPEAWNQWLTATQTSDVNGLAGPRFEHYSLMAEAAAAGLGVALLPAFLVHSEIDRGTLVFASPQRLRSDGRYYIVFPTMKESNADVLAFRDWLLDAIHRESQVDNAGARLIDALRAGAA
ncbi:MAG: LysR family transcriptional regulator [Rhodoferax sp.]|mgnify:FL=1|nr:LysR family transcriptional regulator [Rhodoferax sp.]